MVAVDPGVTISQRSPAARTPCLVAWAAAVLLWAAPVPANDDESVAIKMDWSYYIGVWLPDLPRAVPDEPRLPRYDERKAVAFVDRYALEWTERNGCGTCHTNVPALMMRPLIRSAPGEEVTARIRSRLIEFSNEKRAKPDAFTVAFMVPGISALAINDAESGRPLDPQVIALLDYQYAHQSKDGGWDYPDHEALVPFLERDRGYMATLAALAAGFIPDYFAHHPESRAGLETLKAYLRQHVSKKLHGQIVLLWASVRLNGLMTPQQQADIESRLLSLQNADGGWTLAALGTWPRYDGEPNDPQGPSDGYATGLAALVLCERGWSSGSPEIKKALHWIDTNQRRSGRWYTRSLYAERFRNYLSNMATAYDVMAMRRCQQN